MSAKLAFLFPLFTALTLLHPLAIQAEWSVPKKVFSLQNLPEAIAKAKETNRPLAFIYSDPTTTCGLCIVASETFVNEFDNRSVIVLLEHKDWKEWPKPLQNAAKKDQSKGLPKMYFFDADLKEQIAILTNADYSERGTKAIRDVRRALKAE
jgi:hypothetical protein